MGHCRPPHRSARSSGALRSPDEPGSIRVSPPARPVQQPEAGAQEAISFPEGSMLIKAAWREVEPEEEARFLTADAWIYDLKGSRPTHVRRRRVGLVGFHIMQKTLPRPSGSGRRLSMSTTFPVLTLLPRSGCSDAQANRQTRPGVPNQVTRLTPIPRQIPRRHGLRP